MKQEILFLFPKKKLQETEEEFDRVPILVIDPLINVVLPPLLNRKKDMVKNPQPDLDLAELRKGEEQTSWHTTSSHQVFKLQHSILPEQNETYTSQEVTNGIIILVELVTGSPITEKPHTHQYLVYIHQILHWTS